MIIKSKYLPIASGSALGGIKIGSGLSIDGSGIVSVSGIAISGVTGLTDALSLPYAGLTGFQNRTDSVVTMNSGNLQIAPASSSFSFWTGGTKYTKSTTESVAITNDNILSYVYYDTTGVLTASTTSWDILSNTVPVHMVYRYGSLYKRYEERHSYIRNRTWHEWAHNTVGTRYRSGLGGTFTNSTFSIDSGSVSDEDITLSIATATTCTLMYRATGATYMAFENNISTPYKLNAGVLQYDNAGTLTNVSNNNFVPMWIYATNAASDDYPIHIVVGQAQYTTIANARNAPLPAIPSVPTREWKLIYRAIYQRTTGGIVFSEAADYREVSTGPGSTYTPAVHNNTTQRDAASAHPATSIDYSTTTSGLSATTAQAAIDSLANWATISGASTSANNVLDKTGISSDVSPYQLIRYYKGSAMPTSDADWKYGIAPGTIGTNSITMTFGEYIPQTGDNFYLQKNLSNKNLYLDIAPIPGSWAIVTATDLFETYSAIRLYSPNLKMRLLGIYNCFSLVNDTGAAQPTINIAVDGSNLLSTDYTVTIAGSTPFDSNTGLLTSGALVNANSRITIPCVTTGTNKTSRDMQKYVAFVILN